ncbi:HAD-like domain-containing protein, partial [Mycena haematopus]
HPRLELSPCGAGYLFCADITKQFAHTNGLRTLALAYVSVQDVDAAYYRSESSKDYTHFEQNLVFVSLVGMLQACLAHHAPISKVGSRKGTAGTICQQSGIFGEHENSEGKSYTGRQLDELSHEKIAAVQRANLFSRTEPAHKSQLVDLFARTGLGHCNGLCLTGDGVNDAAALEKADIGVAMGSGADVAKLAVDIVLANSDFATIELAVEEGRFAYNNTKQFICYLVSSNIGEVISIFLTVLLGMPEVLIPIQLLWINLVTDSLPVTTLGFNPRTIPSCVSRLRIATNCSSGNGCSSGTWPLECTSAQRLSSSTRSGSSPTWAACRYCTTN